MMCWVDVKQDAPEKTWQKVSSKAEVKVSEEREEVRVKFC